MYCPTCGKELYVNGEDRFNCPFCGAEVVSSGVETEETLEECCKRLERELARQKVKAEIEERSAFEHFWFRGGNLFSMLYRQSARDALERGDIESAKKNLASANKAFHIGCIVYVVVFILVVALIVMLQAAKR